MKMKFAEMKRRKNARDASSPAFEEDVIRRLAESIKKEGLLQPLIVAALTKELLAGNRRLSAMESLGMIESDVKLIEGPLTESQKDIIGLTENFQRVDLTPQEQVHGCIDLTRLNPTWSRKDCAAQVHLDPGHVTRLLSYLDASPAAQKAFDEGRIRLGQLYAISKAPDQAAALAAILGGTQPMDRLDIPLGSGSVVTVKGKNLSLDDAIKTVGKLLSAMKGYRKNTGTDAKAFIAMMKDKTSLKSVVNGTAAQ